MWAPAFYVLSLIAVGALFLYEMFGPAVTAVAVVALFVWILNRD